MSRGKARGTDDVSIDLIKDTGDFLQEKLAIPFTKYLQTCFVPSTWKIARIISSVSSLLLVSLKLVQLTAWSDCRRLNRCLV